MNIRSLWERSLSMLRVRPVVGGLEISDTFLRFVRFQEGAWETASLRLPPNLVQAGKITDYAQFVQALLSLHDQILGPTQRRRKANVVVSLSSVKVYSQVFSLPVVKGENLEKAIQLNIQMVSPDESSQTYSGWELLGEDRKSVRLEILSSFINRELVDEINRALRDANFVVHSIESRALSLNRLVRQLAVGFDREKSYLVLSLDSTGLEFLIIRRAQLFFQYFNSWRDLYGEEKEVTREAFEAALIRNLQQVLNFYNSHWQDPLSGIFLSATALQEEVIRILNTRFPTLPLLELQLNLPQPLNPDWFVVAGSALRGKTPPWDDREISLLGISAREDFQQTQVSLFLRFWRVVVPVSLSIMLLVFAGTDISFTRTQKSLQAQVQGTTESESKELKALQEKVADFNRSVGLIQYSLNEMQPKMALAKKIRFVGLEAGVNLVRIYIQGKNTPILLTGKAKSEDGIRVFSEQLKKEPGVQRVEVPLTDIRSDPDGVSFSMTVLFASSNTP